MATVSAPVPFTVGPASTVAVGTRDGHSFRLAVSVVTNLFAAVLVGKV